MRRVTRIVPTQGVSILVKPFAVRPVQTALRKKESFCSDCTTEVAAAEALFKIEGAIFVRKYCKKCLVVAEYES
jgi:hypothetical protein